MHFVSVIKLSVIIMFYIHKMMESCECYYFTSFATYIIIVIIYYAGKFKMVWYVCMWWVRLITKIWWSESIVDHGYIFWKLLLLIHVGHWVPVYFSKSTHRIVPEFLDYERKISSHNHSCCLSRRDGQLVAEGEPIS